MSLAGTINCPNCGAPIAANSTACQYCGEALPKAAPPQQGQIVININEEGGTPVGFSGTPVAIGRAFSPAVVIVPVVLVVVLIVIAAVVVMSTVLRAAPFLGGKSSQLLSKNCTSCSDQRRRQPR